MASNEKSTETSQPSRAEVIRRGLSSSRSDTFRVGVVIGTLVTIAVVVLIAQNGESARLDWLMFTFSSPLWIMLVLTLLSGAVVWELAKMLWHRSRRIRKEQKDAVRAARDVELPE
jgi:uncharacterized integral membrane protein